MIQPPGNALPAYEVGQVVPFLYSSADEAGGSGLRTCDGFVASPPGLRIASGDDLPTSVTGVFLLNVVSEDWAGNWTGNATQYRVFPHWIDNDGVAAATEDAAPNAGDANGDGIADGQQANVVSLPNARDGRYITLDVARWDSLEHVQSTNPAPPAGETLSVGAVAFDIVLPDFYGDSVPVTLHLPAGTHPDKYFEQDAGGAWVDISDEVTFSGDTVTRSFLDGGPGDSDGSWNGRIVVRPGGPVGVDDGHHRPNDLHHLACRGHLRPRTARRRRLHVQRSDAGVVCG